MLLIITTWLLTPNRSAIASPPEPPPELPSETPFEAAAALPSPEGTEAPARLMMLGLWLIVVVLAAFILLAALRRLLRAGEARQTKRPAWLPSGYRPPTAWQEAGRRMTPPPPEDVAAPGEEEPPGPTGPQNGRPS